jgi:hypothetical protein
MRKYSTTVSQYIRSPRPEENLRPSEYEVGMLPTNPVLKAEINGRGDPLRWPRDTLYPQKLAPT